MTDHASDLKNFQPTKDFFIGVDSDGCAFDTMELKHKECFTPNTILHWGLQPVSRYAREAADFVNLYGRGRGLNRFPALVRVLELLAERPEALARGYRCPEIGPLRAWIEQETRLGNPALAEKVAAGGDAVLRRALEWSTAVNDTIERFVHGVPPFPGVAESLDKVGARADVMVVSATPLDALQREWAEHDLERRVNLICGQEAGNKAEHIRIGAVGRYASERILMVGDAPGDLKAAKANDALFYPIVPGREDESWRRFHDEAADNFFQGSYAGAYENALVEEFLACLPETPPWKTL